MKKILLLALVSTFGFASSGLAETTLTSAASTDIGAVAFKPSTGVTLIADATDAAYSVGAKHLNGDRSYGSDNTSADIWEVEAEKGAALEGIPANPAGAASGG